MKINDNWQEYQRADIDTDAKEKVLTKIIDDVGEIVQSLSPILEHETGLIFQDKFFTNFVSHFT